MIPAKIIISGGVKDERRWFILVGISDSHKGGQLGSRSVHVDAPLMTDHPVSFPSVGHQVKVLFVCISVLEVAANIASDSIIVYRDFYLLSN